jgi:hypothetical protein
MAEEGLNRISLRVPSDLFKKLEDKRHHLRTTFQEVGLALFADWLSGKQTVLPPDPPVIGEMREFLEIADRRRAAALTVNVEVFLANERQHRKKKTA